MKNYFLILMIVAIGNFACNKGYDAPPGSGSTSLTGKWSVVRDSIYYDHYGPTPVGFKNDSVYIGNMNDFWEFDGNTTLTRNEAGILDSVHYKSYAYNLVFIDSFSALIGGAYLTDSVITIGTNHIIIKTPPSGYYREVELKK